MRSLVNLVNLVNSSKSEAELGALSRRELRVVVRRTGYYTAYVGRSGMDDHNTYTTNMEVVTWSSNMEVVTYLLYRNIYTT